MPHISKAESPREENWLQLGVAVFSVNQSDTS